MSTKMFKERWEKYKEYVMKEGDYLAIATLVIAGISIAIINQALSTIKKRKLI